MAQEEPAMEVVDDGFDFTTRNVELEKIVKVVDFLHTQFVGVPLHDKDTFNVIDLDLSNNLAGILHTFCSYMRKMQNSNIDSRGNLNADKTAEIGTVMKSIGGLYTEFMAKNKDFKMDFKIATPLIDALTSFRCMWDEVRLSCSAFKLRVGNKVTSYNVRSFGLNNSALPRLNGITWKPERRSGMIKCMGPLTLAILLAAETRYKDKLETALRNSIDMLPMAEQIVECFSGLTNPVHANDVMCELNAILMVMGYRSPNKMHFPLLFVAKSYILNSVNTLKLTFSGLPGFAFYNNFAPLFHWKKKSLAVPEDLAQVVFHSIFGTLEDLGILAQITTNAVWKQRKELDAVFQKDDKVVAKKFTPIRFVYVSKMVSANIVKGSSSATPQIDCKYIFSGHRKRNYSEAFMGFLERGNTGIAYSKEVGALSFALKNYRTQLIQDCRNGKLMNLGTTDWYIFVGDSRTADELPYHQKIIQGAHDKPNHSLDPLVDPGWEGKIHQINIKETEYKNAKKNRQTKKRCGNTALLKITTEKKFVNLAAYYR